MPADVGAIWLKPTDADAPVLALLIKLLHASEGFQSESIPMMASLEQSTWHMA